MGHPLLMRFCLCLSVIACSASLSIPCSSVVSFRLTSPATWAAFRKAAYSSVLFLAVPPSWPRQTLHLFLGATAHLSSSCSQYMTLMCQIPRCFHSSASLIHTRALFDACHLSCAPSDVDVSSVISPSLSTVLPPVCRRAEHTMLGSF